MPAGQNGKSNEMTAPVVEATLRIALTEGLPVLAVSGDIVGLLGFTAEEFLSSKVSLKDRIHPDDADVASVLFVSEIQKESVPFNLRMRHADGRIRCIVGHSIKAAASGGGAVILDLHLQDAKSLRRISEVQQVIASLKAMMENTDDVIYFKDRNHVLTAASQTMVPPGGAAKHWTELIGKTDYDSLPEEFADLYYEMEKQIFAGKPVAQRISAAPARDGEEAWVDNRKFPIENSNGEIIGLFGIARDVTEQKKAEEALRESERSLKEAQKIAGIGSYVLDIRNGMWSSSDVMNQVLGIDETYERTVAGWEALIYPDDRAMMDSHFRDDVLGNGQLFDKEYRIVREADQAVRWVHGLGNLEFDAQGKPLKMRGTIQDITGRKLVQEKLAKSAERLARAQQVAKMGFLDWDLQTGEILLSEETCRLYGIDNTEFRSTPELVAKAVHPDDQERVKRNLELVLQGKQAYDLEHRIVRPDGTILWTHSQAEMFRDADGRPKTLLGTTLDITERKQADEKLRESEESLRESQKIAGLGTYVLDNRTEKWTSSDVLDEMFGIDKEYEHTRAAWLALIHLDDRARLIDHVFNEVEGQGKPLDWKYRIIRKSDGETRWMHAMGRQEFDAQGHPFLIRGTIQDITESEQAAQALRESEELLQMFIEHAPAALAMFDREMRYLAVSRRWVDEYSLAGRDVIGKCHYDVIPDIPERWKEMHRRGLAGETLRSDEDRFERADGSEQWIRWEIRPWRSGDGAVGGIILFAEDITRNKQTEERLRLAASVFTHAREGILIADADGAIVDVNETFSRISGYSREEVLGRNPRLLKSGVHGPEFYAEMWRTLKEKEQWSGEVWNRAKSGDLYAELLAISAVRNESGKVHQYVALFSDITAIKEHERQLEHIAHYDVLTGLPNRVLLGDRLSQAMAQSHRRDRKLAVAYLDLDGFKAINDRHGHEAGDLLLSAAARNMKQTLREGDTLSRLGGDEFVAVLLDLTDIEASEPILRRLLDAAAEPVPFGDFSLQVTASVGVAFFPQAEEVDADQLLRQADQAMYQAKLAGKNRYHVFDFKQDRSVRGHHEDLEHIAQALAAHEFVLYYQPKVNMRTGAVIGAEALIRWQHPERGLLPPAMFLPVIEDHRLSVEVGDWVIESALTQMERWQAEGLHIPVSVNVSAQQLQQADFVEHLRALLAAHPAIKPSSLELEVLETSALQDLIQISQVINGCREIGVLFALDDFGTGYSSLTYLKRLPVSVLKIDQSFVREILEDAESLSILEGVLGLATAFRRQVIAEGVESVEHGLLLLQLGCELAQGYGIARPMPAEKFPGWLAEWRPDPRWERAPAVNQEGRPVLYAGVDHRAWIAAIDAFLKGERHIAPVLDSHECRFCGWLQSEEGAGRGWLPELQAIEAIHWQIHELAAALLERKVQHWDAEGVAGLGELHGLQTALLEQLEILMQIE